MSLLQVYLQKPNTQRVLSRKPGDQGFSLIELVVVVAVLAILAAVAIPAFTSINDKAAVAAAQNTLTQIIKECAVKKANNETQTFIPPNLNSYTLSSPTADTTSGLASCSGSDNLITLKAAGTTVSTTDPVTNQISTTTTFDNEVIPKSITINVISGAKSCEAGTKDTDNRFCTSDGKW